MRYGLGPVCKIGSIFLITLTFLVVAPVLASEMAPVSNQPSPELSHALPEPEQDSEPTPVPGAQSGDMITLTGRLNLLHGDPQPGTHVPPQVAVLLTENDGTRHELMVESSTVLELDRQVVQVTGRVTTPDEFSVQPADSTASGVAVWSIRRVDTVESFSQPISGSKPWVNILCRFSDIASSPHPVAWYNGLFGAAYPGLDHYWRQVSYNNLNIQGTQTRGWYTLPHPRSYYVDDSVPDYGADLTALAEDCARVAEPDVYFPAYAGINLMFNSSLDCCAWGGSMYIELDGLAEVYSMTWLPPWSHEHSTIAHEMGHGFGLPHSSGPADNPPDELDIYVSQWDVMSDAWGTCAVEDTQYGCIAPGTISYHLDISDWIPASRRIIVPEGEVVTITLERLQLPVSSTNYLMAKVPILGSSTHFYTVEVRVRAGYDQNVPGKAVVIHDVNTRRTGNAGPALVVDADDGNDDVNDAGSRWVVGETYIDTTNNILIEVLSSGTASFTVKISNIGIPLCQQVTQIPASECSALETLYDRTRGPHWTSNNGWTKTKSPCNWYGVTCSAGHVIGLNLKNNNLTGRIPYQLRDLVQLQTLNLRGNNLRGDIPDQLGELANLSRLYLQNNRLSGGVPSQLGDLPNLQRLYLQNNLLVDNLPANLANLGDTLLEADFGYNRFTASNSAVIAFLDSKDPDWASTQTVPPTHVRPSPLVLDTRIRVAWRPISYTADGGFYRVYYATSPGGPYTTGCTTTSKSATSCRIDGISPNTDYYFKVRTYTQAHGEQSALWSRFSDEVTTRTLQASPLPASIAAEKLTAPNLLAPESDAVLDTNKPRFEWEAPADTERYKLQVSVLPDFSTFVFVQNQPGTVYSPEEALADGVYYWRVSARGSDGLWSDWSAPQKFTVDTTEPEATGTPTPTDTPTAVELPFTDSFDSAAGWTASGVWRLDTQPSQSAWFADSTQRGQVSYLSYDNSINLSGSSPIELSFWYKFLLTAADQLAVDISLDGNLSWVPVVEFSATVGDWTQATADLTPYLGQFISLRFRLDTMAAVPDSTSTLGLWIDDVAIDVMPPSSTPTNTPEVVNTETPTSTPTDLIEPTETSIPTAEPSITPTATNIPLPALLPFVETFDSGQGWLPVGAWVIDPQNARGGVSWFANSTLRDQHHTLTYGGLIDLRMAFNPQLSFWQKSDLSSSDVFGVDISLDGGISWQPLDQQAGGVLDWTRRVVDLVAYRGQVITLRFRLDTVNVLPVGEVTVGLWIDDLVIEDVAATPTPTNTPVPSDLPTVMPTDTPTETPTALPTETPTDIPTGTPTNTPADVLTETPVPVEETAES